MNIPLLRKHISNYKQRLTSNAEKYSKEIEERKERTAYYQAWTKDRLLKMDEDEFYEYIAKMWAMFIWGNKKYVVDKLKDDNGFETIKINLAELVWGNGSIDKRWDTFRKSIKGFGPAMMSEILCQSHPDDFVIWNRRAYVALNHLDVKDLPRHNYQLNGMKYMEICEHEKKIAEEMEKAGIDDSDLLAVDYFIWNELQVEDNLSRIYSKAEVTDEETEIEKVDNETSTFIHNEIQDKLSEIGTWLGFKSQIEVKVADGSKVDTIWEATIGNMGRVIYVFEVQTKGSVDSLILNLLKALNNPAVQGVVAVSDTAQLDKIQKHAANVGDLSKKLKYWDYTQVLQIHEALAMVNESINNLGLVPVPFR